MFRRMMTSALLCSMVLVLSSGCAHHGGSMNMAMEKPTQPVQMKSLERFVGKWTGTAEFSPATAEKMRKAMPVSDSGKAMQTSFASGGEATWILDGMTLRHEGWFEMGEGKRKNIVELWTWNPRQEKYRVVVLDNWGGHAEGWATPQANGEGFSMVMTGVDWQGNAEKGSGTISFSGANVMNWTWTASGPEGKMEFVGTSRRSG